MVIKYIFFFELECFSLESQPSFSSGSSFKLDEFGKVLLDSELEVFPFKN